jgi:carbamoyl-phosphate synthase large subunit
MINILVTGAGGGVGQGVLKSLLLIRDLEINIIAADMSELSVGLYIGDKAYIVPACHDRSYSAKIEEIFAVEKIDYYIPGTDVELLFCASNKQRYLDQFGVKVIVPDSNIVEIADDKYKTYQFLKEHGFFYPQTYLTNEIDKNFNLFPIIAKPRIGCRSIGVEKIDDIETLLDFLQDKPDYIVQEYIGGEDQEYTCTIVGINNTFSDVGILKRTLRCGDTYRAENIQNDTIKEYVTELAKALRLDGSCNFQLRLDSSGTPKVFEINSRYSGTTPFNAQLGFNPVEYYIKKDQGIDYSYTTKDDVVVLRYWSEVLVSKSEIESLKEHGTHQIDKSKIGSINFFGKDVE